MQPRPVATSQVMHSPAGVVTLEMQPHHATGAPAVFTPAASLFLSSIAQQQPARLALLPVAVNRVV